MSSEDDQRPAELEQLELTDPKAMRALAHPVRMALLELLGMNDTLTATQASELLGESPANCAFHLRTLAKYGFVEETGGGRGRERPWRSRRKRIRIGEFADDPAASVAADTLSMAWLERTFARALRAMPRSVRAPDGWGSARQSNHAVLYLTAEELAQIGDAVAELYRPYIGRGSDPAGRPEGSLPAELLFMSYPLTMLSVADEPAQDEPEQQDEPE